MARSKLRRTRARGRSAAAATSVAVAAMATAIVVPSARAPAALGGEAAAGGASIALSEQALAARAPEMRPPAREGVVRPVPGRLIRRFDPPASPYGVGHRGVDLAAPAGAVVRSAMAGTVAFSGTVAHVGWITVDHGGGLRTTYGAIEPRLVRPGQRVRAGQRLGRLADGAVHVDWGAILHGSYIDPMSLLGRWEVHLTRPGGRSGPG